MSKIDDRHKNAQSIKADINNTKENLENTKNTIAETDDENLRMELKERNKRREEAIESLQDELDAEIVYR